MGITQCDGQELKRLIRAGMAWFEPRTSAVNGLNVFPVPDGDTGTNMYLTLQAAWQEIAERTDSSIGAIAQAVAHGALMGARGNSGVILSQIFRGMAQSLGHNSVADVAGFAQALQQAALTAYKAVIRPVEGTILTVVRQAARAGLVAAEGGVDLRGLMTQVVEAAGRAVAETPSLLPVLAEAGVVDAGGQGLFFIFEGMLRYLRGESIELGAMEGIAMEAAHAEHMEAEYGYDVQFVLQGERLDVERIRADINAMGECTLVVGDDRTVKVHVHTPEPGNPLNYAARLGSLSRIIVENMQEQYQEFVKGRTAPAPVTPAPPQPRPKPAPTGTAIIAVVAGAGLTRVYESLGTTVVVPGGQTMNPSTEDLLKAIASTQARDVILLPNNSNVILTAQQAESVVAGSSDDPRWAGRRVSVVPTKSIPQGIGALLAFNYQADLATNTEVMTAAAEAVQSGEVTRAVRSAKIDGVKVEEGQYIGLLNGRLVASDNRIEDVMRQLLQEMKAEELEIITLYYGAGCTEEEARRLADELAAQYPGQEIEVVEGGQPHYTYLVSGE
jgi:DAK2 domain fusion protein YloV